MTSHNSIAAASKESQTKILHINIPESVYWHLRRCAIESKLSMKAFVVELGRTATPTKLISPTSSQNAICHMDGIDGESV